MDNVKLIESLRDFFHYGRKEHLRQAYSEMTAIIGIERNLQDIDWDQEEFIFNRLFVGPTAPLAPAVASVYLEPEGLLQGEVTADIRIFYTSIGLSLEIVGSEPEDALPYELDACRHLLLLAQSSPEAAEVLGSFINKHLSLWIPEFTSRALEHCKESIAIGDTLTTLSKWVECQNGQYLQQKEME